MPSLAPLQPKLERAAAPATKPVDNEAAPAASGVPRFLASMDSGQEAEAERLGEQAANRPDLASVSAPAKLGGVRFHQDGAAQELAHAHGARALTQGSDIYFNRGEFNPSSAAGRALIGHELAHVAQQQAGQAQGVQRKALGDAAEGDRKKLELPSAPTTIPADILKEYFEKMKSGNWGSYRAAPKGVSVELQGIKDEYKTPMTSIAMYMNAQISYPSTVTGVTKPMFGPGISITLQLALAQHGLADAAYRFSWTGDAASGTIYIEAMAAGPKAENTPTETSGKIAVGGLNFEAVGSWSSEQMGYLKRALALIPLDALKQVDGLKFKIRSGSGGQGEEGSYDETTHTVTMFSSAFTTSDVRTGDSPKPVRELAHEIGHAIDIAPLKAAWKKYQSSGKSNDLTGAASPSGSKWETGSDTKWQMADRITKKDGDFRIAAGKDGVGVTKTEVTVPAGRRKN
ncbi:MAG: DUF4157 domain-containing protein [Caldilineaceae bacterium]|nr:DUF4157 domain-containing protein [Caldilineaceae bacterium]